MNVQSVGLGAALLTLMGWSAVTGQEGIRPSEVVPLFNGRNLEGFYTWLVDSHLQDPDRVFSVVEHLDGAPAIRISGQHWGGLTTRDAYRDYRLIVEFRWGLLTWGERKTGARDSGILLHCQGPDGNTRNDFNGPWMRSIETQIIEGGVADFILVAGFTSSGERLTPTATARVSRDRDGEKVWDSAGQLESFTGGRINWFGRDPDWDDVVGFRGKKDVESPLGQWTTVEVVCEGNSITNFVNGTQVNQLLETSLSGGKIMIQSEGAEIYIRRFELRPL